LEVRVHERTAELAVANMLLERESKEHQRAEESLRELTGHLFRLQDEERRRLARELHDGAIQNLIGLAMNLASLREDPSGDQQQELLSDSFGASETIRRL
jgi:signal transduction histidine kinase